MTPWTRRWIAVGLLVAPSAAAELPSPEPGADGALQPVARRKQPLIIATDGPTHTHVRWTPPDPHAWRDGAAFGVAFGAAFVEGVDRGYFGRIEFGPYLIQTRRRGWIVGMLVGVEGWGANGPGDELAWGGSLPWIVHGGLQSDALFATLGFGFDLMLLDRVARDTGVGFFAPEAALNFGVDLEGVRFLLDGRAGYRWQLGADDRGALRAGLAVQLTTD